MPLENATILHSRLIGLSNLMPTIPEQEFVVLLNAFRREMESVVALHQGRVIHFHGEVFTAVFQDNPAKQNALNAAAECRSRVETMGSEKELEAEVGFKAAVVHGPFMKYHETATDRSGNGAEPAYNIMGEAVDMADRLFNFAEAGQLLVNDQVYENCIDHWNFNTLEPIHIPGRKELLGVYEAKEKKRKKLEIKTRSERKIVSEMVGRTQEAEQLEGLIKNLVDGKGTIVNIVGKAGIGKSRLMEEMKVQPVMEKVLLLEGRAVSTGQNLSFHPITNLIKSWAGIMEDDIPSFSSEKLYQGIKRNTPEQADEIYAFLATMMGLPLEGKYKERVKGIEGEALEKLILKNLRDLIIASTRDKPRIYMIEDMHWSDSSSITLFESLYKLSQNHPVIFINVMRPGYKDTGDYILNYLVDKLPGDHTTIHINPLEEKESDNLIRNLLRNTTLPDEIQKMIIRKTEGNPFFIEEIIRSFIDEGIIEVKDGHFVVTDKINNVNIPETINDAILSRVDKLDEKTRELLNTASVMGRNFYYKVLEEATDTIEELDERLSYLSEVQLITETKKKEEIEYLFKHALAQQLTYDAMMQQSRKETHLKIARSIEKVFAANINEFYATLVYHYEQAEDKGKAVYYMLLAGEESRKSGASSEALQFFEKALEAMPQARKKDATDHEIRDLRINLANMFHAVGRSEEAVELFEFIFEKYFNYRVAKTERGIMLRGIWGMIIVAIAFRFQYLFFKKPINKTKESICSHILEWGSPITTINPRHFVFKTSDAIRGFLRYDIMSSQAVLDIYIQIGAVFTWASFSYPTVKKIIYLVDHADIKLKSRPLMSLNMAKSMFNANTGNWHQYPDFDEVFDKGMRIGELWMVTIYALHVGLQQIEQGNYAGNMKIAERIKDLGNSFENSHAIAQSNRLRAVCGMKFRKFEGLQELIDKSTLYIQDTDHKTHLFILYLVQIQLFLHTGHIKEAKKVFTEVEKSLEKNKGIATFYTHFLIVKIQLGLELLETSEKKGDNNKKIIRELLKTSKKLISKSKKFIINLTEAYLLKSKIFIFQQKFNKAFKYFQLAISTGEKYNGRLELSRACFETGKFLSDPNNKYKELNGHPASHYLEKAKNMFEEMDLQWDLEEYRKYNKSMS